MSIVNFDSIYWVSLSSETGRNISSAVNLKDLVTAHADKKHPERITVIWKNGTKREFDGEAAQQIRERLKELSDPDLVARWNQYCLQEALKGPKAKPGRKKATRSEDGRLLGIGSKVKKQIDLWELGKDIDQIVGEVFPETRTPVGKKIKKKRVQANLRNHRHLLSRPYPQR